MNIVEVGGTEAVVELYQPELEFIADLLSDVQDGERWQMHWAWTLAAAFRTAAMACTLKDHSLDRLPSPFTWQAYQHVRGLDADQATLDRAATDD